MGKALALGLALSLGGGWGQAALADGFIIPYHHHRRHIPLPPQDAPISVRFHHVEVDLHGRLAKTKVRQAFVNEGKIVAEGRYLFPVPEGASLSSFGLSVGGKRLAGKLLEAGQAREIYEEIVRQRRDPALLSYAGRNTWEARIFPMNPGVETRVDLEYQELLKADGAMTRYAYTLDTERFSHQPVRTVSVSVRIHADGPLKAIYSPSHEVAIKRLDDRNAIVSYEEKSSKPDREFLLYYATGDAAHDKGGVGLTLLTYRDPDGSGDGYFLLLGAPRVKPEEVPDQPKDIVYVFDTSGSMQGPKIDQARKAAKFALERLGARDRFNVIAFNSAIEPFKPGLVDAREAASAQKFVQGFVAEGSTNIDGALAEGLKQLGRGKSGRPRILLFLTDGEPTVGVTEPMAILGNAKKANGASGARLFVFGVGYDVNAHLLDRLAQQNHGESEYVRPGEDIEAKVAALVSKITHPVLSDLALDPAGARLHDVFPRELPDLFRGSQLMVTGRFRGSPPRAIAVEGTMAGAKRRFVVNLPPGGGEAKAAEFLPRVWAGQKIGYLLDQVRLHGNSKELADEIVALSKRYGIVTEFTSFLVQEETDLGRATGAAAAPRLEESRDQASGGWAVNQSVNAKRLQKAQVPGANYYDAEGKKREVNQVAFASNHGFFRQGKRWIDGRFRKGQPVKAVQAYSEAHFQLSRAFPALNSALGLGDDVIVVLNGHAVHVGPTGTARLSAAELAALRRP